MLRPPLEFCTKMTRRNNSRTSRRAVSVEHFANFAYFDVERNFSWESGVDFESLSLLC